MAGERIEGKCKVVEDKVISSQEMKERLSEFLAKKSTKKCVKKEDYDKLQRFQQALEEREDHDILPHPPAASDPLD